MKLATPLWAIVLEGVGLLLTALGVSAYIRLAFVPDILHAPGIALSLVVLGLLIGLPNLYFKIRNIRQKAQGPQP